MRSATIRRIATMVATGFLLTGTGGCVSLVRSTFRSHDVAANGATQTDNRFRQALSLGNFAEAYRRSGKIKLGAPQDKLLRALYRGTAAFHAGDYKAAAASFAEADKLAEERETRSLSRGAASLVTNDQVLSYLPSRTERLFTRYYAMMSWLRAGDQEAATVEARRLGMMLQATSDSLGAAERATHAMLRDAAGSVFEAAGERNDALVSYRNAAFLRGATPQAIDSITLEPVHPDSVTVVVFVERGFVAHRVNQELTIPIGARWEPSPAKVVQPAMFTVGGPLDVAGAGPRRSDSSDDSTDIDVKAIVASLVGALGTTNDALFAGEGNNWSRSRSFGRGSVFDSFDGPTLSLSWPALVRTRVPDAVLRFVGSSMAAADSLAFGSPLNEVGAVDVSDAIAADLRRALPSMLTRLVIRSAAKAKVTDAIEDKHGQFAGFLVGVAGAVLETADTRSWQLLPGRMSMVRTRVARTDSIAKVRVGESDVAQSIAIDGRAANDIHVTSLRIFRFP